MTPFEIVILQPQGLVSNGYYHFLRCKAPLSETVKSKIKKMNGSKVLQSSFFSRLLTFSLLLLVFLSPRRQIAFLWGFGLGVFFERAPSSNRDWTKKTGSASVFALSRFRCLSHITFLYSVYFCNNNVKNIYFTISKPPFFPVSQLIIAVASLLTFVCLVFPSFCSFIHSMILWHFFLQKYIISS